MSSRPPASRRAPARVGSSSRVNGGGALGDANAKPSITATHRTGASRVGGGGALSVKNVGIVKGQASAALHDVSNGDPIKPTIIQSSRIGTAARASSRAGIESVSNRVLPTASSRNGRVVQSQPIRSSSTESTSARAPFRSSLQTGASRIRTQDVGTSATRRVGFSSTTTEPRIRRSNTMGPSGPLRPALGLRPSSSQPVGISGTNDAAMDVDNCAPRWWEDADINDLIQAGGTDTEGDEDSAIGDDDDDDELDALTKEDGLIDTVTSSRHGSRSSQEQSVSTSTSASAPDSTLGRTLTTSRTTLPDADDGSLVDVHSDYASSAAGGDDDVDLAALDPDFLISLTPELEAAARLKLAAICQRYEQEVVQVDMTEGANARAEALSRGEISEDVKAHEDELALMGLDPEEVRDTSMVAEYSKEIFEYMSQCERSTMPNPKYMDFQNEVVWHMRATLVDWLLQVHMRYHLLPETLWIAINIVDRFLSVRIVSLAKLQLVGVTAMFIAAKYEEILAPSVDEFVFMTENGYSRDEILKGERIILSTLNFNISTYCSPYSWLRRISKADDYSMETRTLSKFLVEVTLLDHRFLRARPSLVAAVGMFLAKKMLGGVWDDAFVYHSMFTEEQLVPAANLLLERLLDPSFVDQFVCRKYANRKFLKASIFAREWAKSNHSALMRAAEDGVADSTSLGDGDGDMHEDELEGDETVNVDLTA